MIHSVVRERSHQRLHLTERRSVESKSEITGLILIKAERSGALDPHSGRSSENSIGRQQAAVGVSDDDRGIDGDAADG